MSTERTTANSEAADRPTSTLLVVLAWLLVGIPLAYGLYETLLEAMKLLG
jgi:hypothetical protein